MSRFNKRAKSEAARLQFHINPKSRDKYAAGSGCGANKEGGGGFQTGNTCAGESKGGGGGKKKKPSPKSPTEGGLTERSEPTIDDLEAIADWTPSDDLSSDESPKTHDWTTGSGMIELSLPDEAVSDMSGPGPADDAVDFWHGKIPLDHISDEDLKSELGEYGAWDEEQLSSREDNEKRLLWIAAGDVYESRPAPDDRSPERKELDELRKVLDEPTPEGSDPSAAKELGKFVDSLADDKRKPA